MRIGLRAGHTTASCGSMGILDENNEARKVKEEIFKILPKEIELIDLQPPESMSYPYELMWGINTANNAALDLGISIHFNNAYKTYEGALGTETWVHPNNSKKAIATAIVNNLSALGFTNRGVKEDGKRLAELRDTTCPWIIIEVCFVEATKDVEIYNNIGAYKVAKAIVEGITGQTVDASQGTTAKYLVTKYLPEAYQGYSGVKIDEYIHKYFEDVVCYVRSDSKGVWIETAYITDADKLNRIANNLNNDGLYYAVL